MAQLTLLKFDKDLEGINKFSWESSDGIVTTKERIWFAPSKAFFTALNQFVEKYIVVYGAYFPDPWVAKLAIAWEQEEPRELSMTLRCASDGGTYEVSLPTLSPIQVVRGGQLIKGLSAMAIDEWTQYENNRPKQLAMDVLQRMTDLAS